MSLTCFDICLPAGNILISSLLSTLLMVTKAIASSILTGRLIIILTSGIFIGYSILNQSNFGTVPGESGKIVFADYADTSNGIIYVMNADGSGQRRLTNSSADETWPSWSPDGTKIAFESVVNDDYGDIYVMNAADGSNQTRLTNSVAENEAPGAFLHYSNPKWSPDGTRIAFDRSFLVP